MNQRIKNEFFTPDYTGADDSRNLSPVPCSGEPKLYEITAMVSYSVVIRADSKEDALKHVETWEHAWDANADLLEAHDVDMHDIGMGRRKMLTKTFLPRTQSERMTRMNNESTKSKRNGASRHFFTRLVMRIFFTVMPSIGSFCLIAPINEGVAAMGAAVVLFVGYYATKSYPYRGELS